MVALPSPTAPATLQRLYQAAVLLSTPGVTESGAQSTSQQPSIEERVPSVADHFCEVHQMVIDKVVKIFNHPTIPLSPHSAANILETHMGTKVEHKVNETVAQGLVATLLK